MKNKQVNQVGLFIQAILLVCVLYFLIMSLFMSEFMTILEAVCGLTLLCMAYNNEIISNKKGITIVYLVIGIFCLGASLFL